MSSEKTTVPPQRGLAPDRDQAAAAHVVHLSMSAHGWSARQLGRAAQVDPRTVTAFLSDGQWPSSGTRNRIEGALQLAAGSIQRAATHTEAPDSAVDQRRHLGLDQEAAGLPAEDVRAVRDVLAVLRQARGLPGIR